jgi:hypothetical protein
MTIWRSISVVLPLFVAMGLDLPLLAKGDLFDRGETSLLPLLSSFQSAGSGFNMSDTESSGLLVRQQRVCPAGYRTYWMPHICSYPLTMNIAVMCDASSCCPSGHNCVSKPYIISFMSNLGILTVVPQY